MDPGSAAQQAKGLAALRPGQATEIISQDMSVPQKLIRLIDEQWFGGSTGLPDQ